MAKQKEIPDEVMAALEADWIAGTLSMRQMQERHGVPVSTFRDRLKAIPRAPADAKRAFVAAQAAGVDLPINGMGSKMAQIIRTEGKRDADGMSMAARGALVIMERAEAKARTTEKVGDLAVLSTALKNSVEVYRKARGLDAPGGQQQEGPVERTIRLVKANG